MASGYVCKFCGQNAPTPYPANCSYTESGTHDWIAAKDNYACKFCGQTASNPYPANCSASNSVKGTHEFI
jgi:hypothetical protein